MRCTTRQPVKRMYKACLQCEKNIDGYGTCLAGFENFYCRKTKDNHCPKVNQSKGH